MEARFGPDEGPFAGKFFVVTWVNSTVYQVTPTRKCIPFVTFDPEKWGRPIGLAFSPDGQHLLVSMYQDQGTAGRATIARVRPDGGIEPEQLVRSDSKKIISLWGMEYAPPGFGAYAGQLFVAATTEEWTSQGNYRNNAVPESGELYRLTTDGELKLVASGFRVSSGVLFFDNRLLVCDLNADFQMLASRELPDGFVIEITPTP